MNTLTEKIQILDLSPEIETLWPELTTAIERVIKSGHFIMGPDVKAFETEVAAFLGTKHAIGCNSGTDALVIGLRALGIGEGDEVITTPFSFFATAESISNVGATPVFVDVDETTMNIDIDQIEAAITPKTKAIMPVHLFGNPVDMDRLNAIAAKHGLKVVEDCAQSFGATWNGKQSGTMSAFGAYSFFPTKNLGCYGDGGLIATDDDALAETCRKLRAHGSIKKYHNEMLGYNSRLDTIQAAILRVKLPHIPAYNEGRRRVATRYKALLADTPEVTTPDVVDGHVFHQYTVRIAGGRRDAVQAALENLGVGTMVYYPIPQHLLPVYKGQFPSYAVAEHLATEVLSLPIWPQMSDDVQDRVVAALKSAIRAG